MPRKTAAKKVPKTRRPKGSGSSYPDKDRGGWEGKMPVGKELTGTDPKTGKPKFKTKYQYFHAPTQAAVELLMRGAKPPSDTVTVSEWCDRWLVAMRKKKLTTQTVYNKHIKKRIRPSLGTIQLTKLTAWDIDEAVAKWVGAPATIRGAIDTLGNCCRAAMRAKILTENPVALVQRPRPDDQEFDLFTREELKRIVDRGLQEQEFWAFAVLALTGARIGEVIALQPGDFDPSALLLSITRTWTPAGVQDEPKTRRSRRTIEIHERLRPVLTQGVPNVHYRTQYHRWVRFLEDLNLRPRGMHQMRHSFASYALADGTSVPDLAAHLGHTPTELLKTYAHPTGTDMRGVAARVVGL